jgi:predicted lipid carrier protein YhbT
MADPTAEFFAAINQREHEPLLEKVSGTVRADIVSGDQVEHWFVSIDRGAITVSNQDLEADCVFEADKATFDRIASGEANAVALVMRGAVAVKGNAELLVLFQRLFPGPPGQREQPVAAGYARRHQ